MTSPYQAPPPFAANLISLRMTRYYSGCAQEAEDGGTACLQAGQAYANSIASALLSRVACEPMERVNIVYELYIECYDPPLPSQPTRAPFILTSTPTLQTLPITEVVCGSDELVCPVSKACYYRNSICDLYDDCGTGYDESSCPDSATLCELVPFRESQFTSACVVEQINVPATAGNGISSNGEVNVALPQTFGFWIDSIIFNTTAFSNGVTEGAFLLFTLRLYRPNVVEAVENITVAASSLIYWNTAPYLHEIRLRHAVRANPFYYHRIEIAVTIVTDAQPSMMSPYQAPPPFDANLISLRMTRYYGGCAQEAEDGGTACLQAGQAYANSVASALRSGVACEPMERVDIVYELYIECYDPQLPPQPPAILPTTMSQTVPITEGAGACISNPCQNGGVCINLLEEYRCECQQGFTGINCARALCSDDELTCPFSLACYDNANVCDSYDDCGTGFDEAACPALDELADICDGVRQNATSVYSACVSVSVRQFADSTVPGSTFLFDGIAQFSLPGFSPVWLTSVTFDSFAFFGEVSVLVMFNISAYDTKLDRFVGNSTVLTAYREIDFSSQTAMYTLDLRVPLYIDTALSDSVRISILSVQDPDPSASVTDPVDYVVPNFLYSYNVYVNYTQYAHEEGECAFVSDACLRVMEEFQQSAEAASVLGVTCLPPELTEFYAGLYGNCSEPPVIQYITADRSLRPGTDVNIVCVAFGKPIPEVRLVTDGGLPIENSFSSIFYGGDGTQSYGYSEAFLTVTEDTRVECRARNDLGEVVQRTSFAAIDETCLSLAEELSDFRNESLVPPCVTVDTIESSSNYYGYPYIVFTPESDGLLYSLELPGYIVQGGVGEIWPLYEARVQITEFEDIPVESRRRRRGIVPIIYENIYYDVPASDDGRFFPIVFTRPVRVSAHQAISVTVTSRFFAQRISQTNGPVVLRYLRCSPDTVDETQNATCYALLESWRVKEDQFIEAGCADNVSALYTLYENCLRVSSRAPVLVSPGANTIPSVIIYGNFTILCPIRGGVDRQWLMKTSRGDVFPFTLPSPILRFQLFDADDQGTYFCEATGGGLYRDTVITSPPITLVLQDVITLVLSVTYNMTYVDLNDPAFGGGYSLRYYIIDALVGREGGRLYESIYRGRTGDDDLASVVVIDTRPGSMVVDYQARFQGEAWVGNQTGLVDEVTSAVVDHLVTSGNYPEVYADSITVGSASTCPASVVSGTSGTLTFPAGMIGQEVNSVEHCAVYTENVILPRATRLCQGDLLSLAVWNDPVLTDCFVDDDINDLILVKIAETPVTADNVTEYSSDLVTATNQSEAISTEGIVAVAASLENIVSIQDPSEEVTINVINVVNNVLNVDEDEFVNALDQKAPTRILDSLEAQVTLFQMSGADMNLTVVTPKVAVVAVQLPEVSVRSGIGFATLADDTDTALVTDVLDENSTMLYLSTEMIPEAEVEAAIVLPAAVFDLVLSSSTGTGMVPVSFFVFQNSLLFQSTNQQESSQKPGKRQAVGSRIIAATVEGVIVADLPAGQEVETTFLELNVTVEGETIDTRSCVFWEKTSTGGRWSTEGCRREDDPNLDRIRCLCNHLTSFAVLMDISGNIGNLSLDTIGVIGCIVSIVFLTILLLTYISDNKIRSRQAQRIHINLCVALWCLYLVFVVGIDRRYPESGCIAVGFILHFFLLASMSWMLAEAVYMYIILVSFHKGSVSKFMRIASLLAWGSPVVVCIIVVCIDTSFYLGDGTYCFVQSGPALYYSVLIPVGLVVLINTIVFLLVTYRLTCGRSSISAAKSTDAKKKRSDARRLLQDLVAFTVLLGLTWAFGFFAIGGARVVFNVLFVIFNSLQGFFVFLMFGVRQQVVRAVWADWFRRCGCCFCEKRDERSTRYQTAGSKPTKSTDLTVNAATSHSLSHDSDSMLLQSRVTPNSSFVE